ncbi:ParB/RepB/Spo0J family partition protein [Pelagibacterium montanilacus]|uniref:ParB/RepB/Spo0J family partition protein n=1 Tax=Pelagibacterium montanilacus TaxID=2185280 RepID=UPI0013DF4CDA|nr:ParB/RepB/Spo0J family partition protein [Pelagibacterium montanilacus]
MTDKPTRLGRGLAALIGDMGPVEAPRSFPTSQGVRRLALDFITASRANPRKDFDSDQLEELTNSIREKGVMQPLLVRPSGDDPDMYEIIAGERRWRAAQRAGLHDVPVIVRDVDDKEALELAIIENVQRSDLNPLEEAQGYGQLMDQFGYTQNDLAHVIGKSRSHVANTLRLLRLPDEVRVMLGRGELTAGHARTLITASDPVALARRIVDDGLSVREAEALQQEGAAQRQAGSGATAAPKIAQPKDADTLALERQLSDVLGLAVTLDHKDKGGRLEIRYKTLDQLDAVCSRLLR